MILPEQPDDAVIPLLDRLQRWRALARLVLVVEAVWPAVWPALAVIGLFLVLALLDAPGWLPASLHLAALLAFAAALLVALGRAAWRFRLGANVKFGENRQAYSTNADGTPWGNAPARNVWLSAQPLGDIRNGVIGQAHAESEVFANATLRF